MSYRGLGVVLLGLGFWAVTAGASPAQKADFEAARHLFYQDSTPITAADLGEVRAGSGNCVKFLSWTGGTLQEPPLLQYHFESAAANVSVLMADPIIGDHYTIDLFRNPEPDAFNNVVPSEFYSRSVENFTFAGARVQKQPTYGEGNPGVRDMGSYTSSGSAQEPVQQWFYVRITKDGKYWTTMLRNESKLQTTGTRAVTSICYLKGR